MESQASFILRSRFFVLIVETFIIVCIFLFVRLALLKEGCMWQITILSLRNHCFNYHTAENNHKNSRKKIRLILRLQSLMPFLFFGVGGPYASFLTEGKSGIRHLQKAHNTYFHKCNERTDIMIKVI